MENINIENIINNWFDMKLKTYDRLEYEDSIYLYYVGEKYADIRIIKKPKYIYYQWKLHEEFSEIIPIERDVFQEFMSKWVGDTFGLKGFTPHAHAYSTVLLLEIPKINN